MRFEYVCGVDVSGGGADQFAWAIAHREGERLLVDLVRGLGGGRQRLDVKEAVRVCAGDCLLYGITSVTGDRYGGDWPAAEFRARGIHYRASDKDRAALYLEMLPLFTAGLIEIPDDRELVRQAKLLERAAAGRGRDRVDHPRGGHDDLINAVALAIAQLVGPKAQPLKFYFGTDLLASRSVEEMQADAEETARIRGEVFEEGVRAAPGQCWMPGD